MLTCGVVLVGVLWMVAAVGWVVERLDDRRFRRAHDRRGLVTDRNPDKRGTP